MSAALACPECASGKCVNCTRTIPVGNGVEVEPCACLAAGHGPARPDLTLAIDPGNVESAFVLIDTITQEPIQIDKVPNGVLLERLDVLAGEATRVGIEMIASYGMPVGREVFETCVWIGRFQQQLLTRSGYEPARSAEFVYRRDVKLHLCGSSRAKDPNVIQALVDRYTPAAPNKGKGTKAEPGWFYGFADDIWHAYAVADTANGDAR